MIECGIEAVVALEFKRDRLNIPDVQQRLHWDDDWAVRAGNPTSYDYGRMREVWLIHLCTDWMGDDGFLVIEKGKFVVEETRDKVDEATISRYLSV